MPDTHPLSAFHPVVRAWFEKAFGNASPPQALGWPSIAGGRNTLIVAPTGSGKTLAAFLWCINHLIVENIESGYSLHDDSKPLRVRRRSTHHHDAKHGVRVLYISPLKALNNDIHRNLEIPLKGIHEEARDQGIAFERLRSAVRTGDTTQAQRAAILRNPPDILITTPESLYLMLSSPKARKVFSTVRYVIVDEIHAISGNKRGVHLSLSLERLERETPDSFVRIGLSATQRPLETIASFLGGQRWLDGKLVPRHVAIVDAGYRKKMDLEVQCVAQDFSDMPAEGVWHLIFPKLIEAVFAHTTTLIFVNNRRLAERIAAKLNELLEGKEHLFHNYAVPLPPPGFVPSSSRSPIIVQAYHGSMSRTARERMESDLKAGRLRVLVSTSALELGIDIGSVDLVLQIQSPKGIARGLQRVGRSGHLVSATSKGRIIVTHRDDLVESAVVAKAMEEHAIEETHVPRDCLDVLAQQIVAMVSVDDWDVDELYDLVRQSFCYRTLSKKIFESVVHMLAGRYTNEAFRELRPRVSWNKVRNTLTALPGSSHLAITNAGTIPDRGYYGVYLEDLKTKVGEVDEEFIYESRTGDTFILGSNVWKMISIDANKIVVAPAPGQPARMPFWKGEAIGRSYELGERIGEFIGEVANGTLQTTENLRATYPIDSHSATNILEYVVQQKEATILIPTHERLVVEGFRDEIGDPRITVHSCFGRGVNGLLGLVLSHRLRERLGIDIQMLYNDNGILFRCSDVERLPLDLFANLTAASAREIILDELSTSPLFGALFRQNAERALLLPKAQVGKRTPLFLQRLRAGDLLQIARTYTDFPIVIETIRDCLHDVLDFEHTMLVVEKIASGEIGIHTAANETPSPFAASILFDFVATYMYEQDQPRSSASGQQQALNRELLGEVVNLGSFKSVARPDAIARVEEQLQFTAETRRARTADELMEILLRLGELTPEELQGRCSDRAADAIDHLKAQRTIIPLLIGERRFFIAAEEVPYYLPLAQFDTADLSSLPEEFRTTPLRREQCLRFVIGRMLRSHAPLTAALVAGRYGINVDECESLLHSFPDEEQIVNGSFSPDSEDHQWCYRPNLERIHRASITILRKEIKPLLFSDFTKFLLRWQHRQTPILESGETAVRTVLEQLQGYALHSELWENEIIRPRIARYDPGQLRSIAARGEALCIGATSGKSRWILRGEGAYFIGEKEKALEGLSATGTKVYDYLKHHGASFLSDIREGTEFTLAALNRGIAELFWAGLITNDVVDEVLSVKRHKSTDDSPLPAERFILTNAPRNPMKSLAMSSVRRALRAAPGWNGRWSVIHTRGVLGEAAPPEEIAARQAEQLLIRYGVVAREIAKREENLLPWPLLALEFQKMELRGEIRRGYFVEGLSGMQFALPAAVNTLRAVSNDRSLLNDEGMIVMNACDPANPYGTGIEVGHERFSAGVRMGRLPSNYGVFERGIPLLWIENLGARISTSGDASEESLRVALQNFVTYLRSSQPKGQEIILEYCDGVRPTECRLSEALKSIGFYRDRAQTMRFELR